MASDAGSDTDADANAGAESAGGGDEGTTSIAAATAIAADGSASSAAACAARGVAINIAGADCGSACVAPRTCEGVVGPAGDLAVLACLDAVGDASGCAALGDGAASAATAASACASSSEKAMGASPWPPVVSW